MEHLETLKKPGFTAFLFVPFHLTQKCFTEHEGADWIGTDRQFPSLKELFEVSFELSDQLSTFFVCRQSL